MPQAMKRNRQSVRRLHAARVAKANGTPSTLKMVLLTVALAVVMLAGFSYSTARTTDAALRGASMHGAEQVGLRTNEEQATLVRNSLNGSSLDAKIKSSEGF